MLAPSAAFDACFPSFTLTPHRQLCCSQWPCHAAGGAQARQGQERAENLAAMCGKKSALGYVFQATHVQDAQQSFCCFKVFLSPYNLCVGIELNNTFWFRWLQQMLVRAQLGT